ncbi:expressed unknown protein [Seminavis robusta]|uniref:Uncharacterized protein n=1 Tax=Seminavis robusta TaxID=568900 RepID=A0A9N8DTC9_9STRA|nr:expressed unknown protein [Seminavis robusta]|eukprot:Sro342_g121710.1 n/a (170) ;mRNA; f:30692-31201
MCQVNKSHRNGAMVQLKPRGILKVPTQAESLFSSAVQEEKPLTKRQSNVTFDITEIRVYPLLLDTSCGGPALTIGWKPVSGDVMTVQEYYLENSTNMRRSNKLRGIKPEDRISMLLNAGYDKEELYNHVLTFKLKEEQERQQSKTIYRKLRKAALKITALKLTGLNAAA